MTSSFFIIIFSFQKLKSLGVYLVNILLRWKTDVHASALKVQTKGAGNLESFPAPLDSPGSNYFSGAENGSDFRAQRSGRMHIQHMHISIIMFSEMGAYLIAAPPFRIRVALGFTVIIKSDAQFVKYNPKDLQYAQILFGIHRICRFGDAPRAHHQKPYGRNPAHSC